MKKMFTLNPKSRSRWMLLLLLLVASVTNTLAQNVTVHPDNGSMMPALKSGETDTFYEWSGFATWKHEQLSLTMTTGDSDNNLTDGSNGLTGSGQLAKPANDIFATKGATLNYITFVSGDGTTRYLNNVNNAGKFTTEKTTIWEVDDEGHVHSGNYYLGYSESWSYNNRRRTLSLVTSTSSQKLLKDNNGFYYQSGNTKYYLHGTTDDSTTPTLANNQTGLAVWSQETEWTGKKYLQIGKGRQYTGLESPMETFITLALPKGYRFTGYTITFHRIAYPTPDGATVNYSNYYGYYINSLTTNNLVDETSGDLTFGETDNTFTFTNADETYKDNIGRDYTTQHKITRTSQTMGNVLYFKLISSEGSGRAFIQLDHMELYFTAENNTQLTIPSTATGTNVSAIDIPFTTSKVDYGQLIMRDIDGNAQGTSDYDPSTGRMSYDGTIRDMNANMILYEDGSVRRDDEANGFDGTVGKMLDYHSGSISAVGDYFQLDPSNHHFLTDDGEAIYYIESPIWAMNTAAGDAAHKNPIGYRIVSAKFTCVAGTGGVYLPATFKIQYESTGHGPDENGTYGLNTYSGTYNWNPSYHTVWRIDQEGYIYGYVSYDGSIRYLAVDGNTISMVAEKPSAANGTFKITENNQICLKSDETKYIGWQETVRLDNEGNPVTYTDDEGNVWNRVDRFFVIAADAAHRSTYHEVTAASESSSAAYTFNIYGPDGTTVAETINGAAGGTKTVYGYNNDAIKIGVIGGTALITAEITMQALDPYIDRLDIVCQENGGTGGRVTQTFNATDFSVKGAPFTFYVPTTFQGNAKFTFENLYSDYGDETYYDKESSTNHARYFFVKSDYEQTAANVYDRNNEDSYTTKILTDQRGDRKFRFNNANTVGSAGGYFEEYAFTPSIYTKSTTQGGTGGTFSDLTFTTSPDEMNGNTEKTAYLFTCDEPRYNIAPTTATQHVYYAFYEMKIKMTKRDYDPILTWTKIYDSSFEGNGKTDSKWGLTLTTTPVTDDQGQHSGYLTVNQILNGIAARTGDNTVTGGPKDTDQILYIDGSNLMSIVDQPTASTNADGDTEYISQLPSLKKNLGQNALIYLPYGAKPSLDNFAYNTIYQYQQTPLFRSAKDIVLTDKYAFYAPYNIQVGAENSAKYTRQLTKSTYTKEDYATVIMPFTIKFDEGERGVKTDTDYGKFTFLQMNTDNATADDYNYMGKTIFFSKTNAEKVEANTPYALHVENKGDSEDCFTLRQYGSNIVATPDDAKSSSNSLFSATVITSTGNLTDKNNNKSKYTFSHKGSFSGYKIPKDTPKTFYFANNGFYSSVELNKNYSTVDLLPFRSVYQVLSGGSAKVGFLHFIEGENNTTGIVDIEKNYSGITTGDGTITITSNAAGTYRIFSAAGQNANTVVLKAGEIRTVYVPAGVYLVNGVKVLVK